ncbi:MAG: helix-turn-helix transcriptional regulator [Cyclobacteriaceae bacterium]
MQIRIKNMVCPRCIKVVREEFEKAGGSVANVQLGEADVGGLELDVVKNILEENGFELLQDKDQQTVEKIKLEMLSVVRGGASVDLKENLSSLLSEKLNKDYSLLSSLFSSVLGITIEKYFINLKIDYAKELLVYDELNNSEIARKLDYSSLGHFSNQFKQITGTSPSEFKKRHARR